MYFVIGHFIFYEIEVGYFYVLFLFIFRCCHIERWLSFAAPQILISEMEDFLERAGAREKAVLQRYVDRFSSVHGFISVVNYLATAIGVTVPLLNPDQSFPTKAVYPFSVDVGVLMYMAYLHQVFAGFQCSAGVTIDCQVAVLMWFAGARLEILAEELKFVSDTEGIRAFVKKHRKLLADAVDVSDTMSYIAIASSTACGIAAIMSSLQLFGVTLFERF